MELLIICKMGSHLFYLYCIGLPSPEPSHWLENYFYGNLCDTSWLSLTKLDFLLLFYFIEIDSYIHIKRFIIKNWLAWLRRLRSHKLCSRQAENRENWWRSSGWNQKGWEPWEPIACSSRLKPTGLRPKKSQCFHLRPEAGENWCPRSKAIRQGRVSSLMASAFLFCCSSVD